VIRRVVPQTGLGAFFMEVYPKLRGALRAQGSTPAGPQFARYYNGDPSAFDVEAGLPFRGSFMQTADEIRVVRLPGGRAAKTLHVGAYDTLSQEYRRLETWIAQKRLRAAEGPWESYIDDPAKTPQADVRTEVFWPLR
jgi:effector-binding domain-containing protein